MERQANRITCLTLQFVNNLTYVNVYENTN